MALTPEAPAIPSAMPTIGDWPAPSASVVAVAKDAQFAALSLLMLKKLKSTTLTPSTGILADALLDAALTLVPRDTFSDWPSATTMSATETGGSIRFPLPMRRETA